MENEIETIVYTWRKFRVMVIRYNYALVKPHFHLRRGVLHFAFPLSDLFVHW